MDQIVTNQPTPVSQTHLPFISPLPTIQAQIFFFKPSSRQICPCFPSLGENIKALRFFKPTEVIAPPSQLPSSGFQEWGMKGSSWQQLPLGSALHSPRMSLTSCAPTSSEASQGSGEHCSHTKNVGAPCSPCISSILPSSKKPLIFLKTLIV